MNTTQTLQQLKDLKLTGMASSYDAQLALPLNQQLETHELLAHLVQTETLHRINEKTAAYLKLAKLRLSATIEQIECAAARGLTKQQRLYLWKDNTSKPESRSVLPVPPGQEKASWLVLSAITPEVKDPKWLT